MTKNWKKFTAEKNCFLPIPRPPKGHPSYKRSLQASALKREHPPLQNKKFLNFILFLWVILALLDPDSESGSSDLIESGSNPDPKHCR
jgi:hypothetical protein